MEFNYDKATKTATSSCGHYTIIGSLNNAKLWWNATYLPSHRSIEASYDREVCKATCEKHAQRMMAQKESMTGIR